MIDKTNEKQDNVSFFQMSKIILKTLLNIFIIICLVICFSFFVFPSFSLKISKLIGNKTSQSVNYENIYLKSKSNVDLYNWIVFESNEKDYEKELELINILTSNKNYETFCKNLNDASLKQVEDRALIPYSCNVNSYMVNQKVVCLYWLNKDSKSYILENLIKNDLNEISYATYIDLICSDSNLSETQKQIKINELNDTFKLDSENNALKVSSKFESRIESIKTKISAGQTFNDAIILQYSLMRNYRAGYLVSETLNDQTKKDEYLILYNTAKNELVNYGFNYKK